MTGTDDLMKSEDVQILCEDGYRLHGTYFCRQMEADKLPILLSPATGVQQGFYFRFCSWLSAQGYDVLVFDYRGIGKSLHGHIRDCDALLQHWGERDQVAALDWLLQHTGQAQALLLGHSAGGQMMGIMSNHDRIARAVSVSGSTGFLGGMPWRMKATATFMLKAYIPANARLFGYVRAKAIGWGLDLPAGVALQWAEWCSKPGYVLNDLGKRIEQDYHPEIRFPITAIHAADDGIATPANVQDLLRLYPNAPPKNILLNPGDFGFDKLGHIDMFRKSHQAVWPVIERALQPEGAGPKPRQKATQAQQGHSEAVSVN